MDSKKIRKEFLDFFEKRDHAVVSPASLLPSDPSCLFTSAGMQQFKEYYLGKIPSFGNNAVTCQPCFRTSDIDEVGDKSHLTFLEMLGNFSFGGYFKKESIEMAYGFMTEKMGFDKSKLWFTYFKGDKEVPRDKESEKILLDMGVPAKKIHGFGKEDNFWGPTGLEGPCGPTVEIHYEMSETPCKKGKNCRPNCGCGRFVELWNLVFNEYNKDREGSLTLLKKKGVDTGMGLERLAMVSQGKNSVFGTDLFSPLLEEIRNHSSEPFSQNPKPYRIIVDHVKGAVFLASEGIIPSNVEQGYMLRRIIRRTIRFGKLLGFPDNFILFCARKVVEIYEEVYPNLKSKEEEILTVIQKEGEKFSRTLEKGIREFEKIAALGDIEGANAFYLFDTYGFPLELTQELAKERGLKVDIHGFEQCFKKHREVSRAGAGKKFGGVGKDAVREAVKLHTATHLLHAALRRVLGKNVKQMGSDVTPARLRFDFSYPVKITDPELEKIQEIVNQKIKENLTVKKEEMSFEEAVKSGALAFFKEKYPENVSVYSAGDFSREICAGPHVEKTSELGHFKIVKEESSGAGIRRIRAILE